MPAVEGGERVPRLGFVRVAIAAAFIAGCVSTVVLAGRRGAGPLAPPGRGDSPSAGAPGLDPRALPLAFELNAGQHDLRARFAARTRHGAVYLTPAGVRFALAASGPPPASAPPGAPDEERAPSPPTTPALPAAAFELSFPGAAAVEPVAEAELPGKVNYFLGNDPARWRSRVPTFQRIRYRGVHPGVDVVFYGDGRQIEYDFELAPGADPALARVAFRHVDGLRVDAAGDLHVSAGGREVVQRRPRVYQQVDGRRVDVGAAYVVEGHEVAVALGSYRRDARLVIDPVILYATRLGGADGESASAVAVDATGAAHVVGYTMSADFPTCSPLDAESADGFDVFVTKLAPDGRSVAFSTYLGGDGTDWGNGIAVHASGIYVAGSTASRTFPTTGGAFQRVAADAFDGYVVKLSLDGSALLFSTYFGGAGWDDLTAVAVDAAGNAYVVGSSTATDFPTTDGAYLTTLTAGDISPVVAKLPPDGSRPVYSTFLSPGKSTAAGTDSLRAVAVDATGAAFVLGTSYSTTFPLVNPVQRQNRGNGDLVVAKLGPTGRELLFSTYLGGSQSEAPAGIVADGAGGAWITGTTGSFNFPVAGQVATSDRTLSPFVTHLGANGALQFSTYWYGSASYGSGIVLDGATGDAVIAGRSGKPPCPGGIFVARFPAGGGPPLYSRCVPGATGAIPSGLGIRPPGDLVVAGQVPAVADFATSEGAFQRSAPGGFDAFVLAVSPLTLESLSPPSGAAAGNTTLTIDGSGFVPGTTVQVGGVAATDVQVVSQARLTAATPANLAGTYPVTVATPDGVTTTLASAFTYVNPPTLGGVSPSSGPAGGHTTVSVRGGDFQLGAVVAFGDAGASSTSYYYGPSELEVTTPPHDPGFVDVTVTNPDGQSSVAVGAFEYVADPTVAAVLPASCPTARRTPVTISGTDFRDGATVSFGGVAATDVTFVSSAVLTATTPLHAAGRVDVVVANPNGRTGTAPGGFTFDPPPALATIVPAHGPATLGQTVALSGSDFRAPATVRFGALPGIDPVVASSRVLMVGAPPQEPGTVDVTVVDADGQSTILAGAFVYDPPPALDGIAPVSGGEPGGEAVLVTGRWLVEGATVTFGEIAAASVVFHSPGSLTATAPGQGPGVVDVRVINPDGQAAGLAAAYRYLPDPTLSAVAPSVGPGTGGTRVTLSGTGFLPGATVRFGRAAATYVEVVSGTRIAATTPVHAGGPVTVTVANPAGRPAPLVDGFTYVPPPTVGSVTPAHGPASFGAQVIIAGSDFRGPATVLFGQDLGGDPLVVDSTTLSVGAPPHAPGAVDVTVVDADGQSHTLPAAFTYDAPPAVHAVLPWGGTPGGGTAVVLTGDGFRPGAAVTFDGVPASDVQVRSATELSATTPDHDPGAVDVVVTNADRQAATLAGGFLYAPGPILAAVRPATGPTGGGTSVVLDGSGFLAGATVAFDGVAATTVAVSPTAIAATTPPHAGGAVGVVVTNPTGQSATRAAAFTYLPPPAIAAVTPAHGPATLGQAVTLRGADFRGPARVVFGAGAPIDVVAVTSTSLSVTAPPHEPGAVAVTLVDADGQSHTLAAAFTYDPAPALADVAPSSGPEAGGGTVILTGERFAPGARVRFGDVPAAGVSIAGSTSITAVVPAHAGGAVNVVVTNPDGQAATAAYRYLGAATSPPIQSAYGCASGPTAGGTSLLLGVVAAVLRRPRRREARRAPAPQLLRRDRTA